MLRFAFIVGVCFLPVTVLAASKFALPITIECSQTGGVMPEYKSFGVDNSHIKITLDQEVVTSGEYVHPNGNKGSYTDYSRFLGNFKWEHVPDVGFPGGLIVGQAEVTGLRPDGKRFYVRMIGPNAFPSIAPYDFIGLSFDGAKSKVWKNHTDTFVPMECKTSL